MIFIYLCVIGPHHIDIGAHDLNQAIDIARYIKRAANLPKADTIRCECVKE
jgi:hypothetical protein